MSNKPRPENASGPNGLRGGIKQYSTKTTTGPWLEEIGGPQFYKRGFTTVDFETEAQHQQKGALFEKQRLYGSGLPLDPVILENHKANENDTSHWQSVSQASTISLEKKKKVYKPIPREKLEEYRKTWTVDSEVSRSLRFQTESRLAGNAANGKFQTSSIRLLPGAPKSLEKFREKLIEQYGVLAMIVLKYYIGTGEVPIGQLNTAMTAVGITMNSLEVNQILAYVTPSTTSFDAEQFMHLVKGNIKFSPIAVNKLFKTISGSGEEITMTELHAYLNSTKYPEIVEGLKMFISSYLDDNHNLSLAAFLDLHEALYAAAPQYFEEIMSSIWSVKH